MTFLSRVGRHKVVSPEYYDLDEPSWSLGQLAYERVRRRFAPIEARVALLHSCRGAACSPVEISDRLSTEFKKRVALTGFQSHRFQLPGTVLLFGVPRQLYPSSGRIQLQPWPADRTRVFPHAGQSGFLYRTRNAELPLKHPCKMRRSRPIAGRPPPSYGRA